MNYDLAKQLKEAGFTQSGKGELTLHAGRTDIVPTGNGTHTVDAEALVYHPTLTELIGACRGGFGALMVGPGLGTWTARGNGIEIHTATPEEAVANLWLALNSSR